MTPQREIATKLLKKFPTAATLTLAKRAYKDNPEVFATLESARTCLRTLRGASGGKANPELVRPKGKAGQGGFDRIPEGWTDLPDWKAEIIEGPAKTLILSDVHIPYHHKDALVSALKYGKDRKADLVLLNGDIADFFAISRWEKDPRKRRFAEELKLVKEFLRVLRDEFFDARIVFKKGNHSERWDHYMRLKAPELLDVPNFQFDSVLGLYDYGVSLVGDMRPIKLGSLNIIHGHEYRAAASNPVNPARGFFQRAKVHCLGGHYHQSSQHSETNLEGKVVSTWSTGCLCDLHPEYLPINNWSHGFAFVEVDKDGAFQVDNLKIIDGKVY